jgi:flagellar biosynthesis protein FlhF
MNVRRFAARTARDALAAVRQTLGDDAVVLSTKPCPEGVEVLAMAGDSMEQIDRMGSQAPTMRAQTAPRQPATQRMAPQHSAPQRMAPQQPAPQQTARSSLAARAEQQMSALTGQAPARPSARNVRPAQEPFDSGRDDGVHQDVEQLAMSTLSFQDYVRERMLKKRQAALREEAAAKNQATLPETLAARRPAAASAPASMPSRMGSNAGQGASSVRHNIPVLSDELPVSRREAAPASAPRQQPVHGHPQGGRQDIIVPQLGDEGLSRREQQDMMTELRSMKGLIEERFGSLAFMQKLQRQPEQARLSQKLLDSGFSPAMIRKMIEALNPHVGDETSWATGVLERNLHTADHMPNIEDQGGVFALIGATGVGKTTTTAKLAAAFATKHGAQNLGLITLDAYRLGAHEQLKAYGRILGVPVHIAHDRASLDDLLDLLSSKKMILIDTAGMAQRDSRTRELLDMLSHPSIQKLLVVNAAAQGETIEDVLVNYRANACKGVLLSKIDEAVKLGPALDAIIRHKITIWGVANGQRVPEDWHRLSSAALVQRALKATTGQAWRMDAHDVNLVLAGPAATAMGGAGMGAAYPV